jgi:isochorismate synthase
VKIDAIEDGESTEALAWAFTLAAPERRLLTQGLARRLEPGPAHTLAERVREFFRTAEGVPLLVGALPFDRQADDVIFQPAAVAEAPLAAPGPAPAGRWRVTPEPGVEAYKQAVSRALNVLATNASGMDKVVLSRSLVLDSEGPIDAEALAARVGGDPGAVRFSTPLGRAPDGSMRRLIGASPELLVSRVGDKVVSHPLAGSARRSDDEAQDVAARAGLVQSDKEQREHALVVEAILDTLAPYCRELSAPDAPDLITTRTMRHLGTWIEGRLKRPDEVSSAELAAALHPTPAVAGSPRDAATQLIHDLEGYDRGFYAGTVGWTDAAGDGVWYLSLRCAEVAGSRARLYAGAGIVEGSVPESEAAETSAKFQAMLRAFGIDEAGQRLDHGA